MDGSLTANEKSTLLSVARKAIENQIFRKPSEKFDIDNLSLNLRSNGASFVTLTTYPGNQLRGCIGTLEAFQPLILDVQEHAIAAAFEDYRFSPVNEIELKKIKIEISRLSIPVLLDFDSTNDLLLKLRPGIDGVIIKDGFRRATFLPQVWEKIESKENFLSQLCLKMGAGFDLWKKKHLQVFIYQVEEFHE